MSGPCEGFTVSNVFVLLLCIYLIRRRLAPRPQATPSRGGLFAKALAKRAAKKGLFELFGLLFRRR